MRLLAYFLILLVCAAGLSYAISYFISPPGGGKELMNKYGIPYPTIIAHRGLSYLAPEETAPAYLLAIEAGADYLEMDIQRTKDGILIAVHDETFERTSNIAEVFPSRKSDPIGSFTLEEIKRLDAGSWFNATHPDRAQNSYAGLKVLTLEEIIDLAETAKNKIGLYIETKSADLYPGYEEQIVEMLKKRYWLQPQRLNRVIFQSFVLDSLKILKTLAPDIPLVYLIDDENPPKWSEMIAQCKGIVHGIGPPIQQALPWNIASAHQAELFVHVWTIDQTWQMWLVKQMGADGIFTNRPDAAVKFYRKSKI